MIRGFSIAPITKALILTAAIALTACSSKEAPPGAPTIPDLKIKLAPPGSCNLDAAKMCNSLGGLSGQRAAVAPTAAQTTYANSTTPESVEFQIPAGQAIKLMCYYDQPHAAIVRADATPDSPLTDNSVAYLKSQGFCAKK
jgi:hypothetical protein